MVGETRGELLVEPDADAGLLARVHVPLLSGGIVSGLLLVFVDVMKELPATMVLRPFDSDTLAVVTYQLARDERLAEASLPALALVTATPSYLSVPWVGRLVMR